MKTAILLPTIYRPQGLDRVLRSFSGDDVDIYIVRERDDTEAIQIAKDYNCAGIGVVSRRMRGPAAAWNDALVLSLSVREYDAYVLASDDDEFIDGWLDECNRILTNNKTVGMVGLNDGTGKWERAGFVTKYLMTYEFIKKHNGGIAAYPYPTGFCDVETTHRAIRANVFAYAENALVVHHWRENMDLGYRNGSKHIVDARTLFAMRSAKGFPDDIERIVK